MMLTKGRIIRDTLICAAVALAAMLFGLAVGENGFQVNGMFDPGSLQSRILLQLRLPRVLLAACVGMALAVSGATLQSLTRNSLADPFVLGVSGGAALGATLAMALGFSVSGGLLGLSAASLCAWAGAMVALILVLSLSQGGTSHAVLLTGVVFNSFALAAITFVKALVAPDQLGEVLYFLAGQLNYETPLALGLLFVTVVLCAGGLFLLAPQLRLLECGDEEAQSLGANVKVTRIVALILSSLAVSSAVSLAGLVGFVGLLVPHIARLIFGGDARRLIPVSLFLGAAFLVLSDAFARMAFRIFQSEPPVGVITSLLGGPVFLLMLKRRKNEFIG